jgi:hypothetical protein
MIEIKTTIDLRGLEKFKTLVHTSTSGPTSDLVKDVFLKWAARYRSFIQQRFNQFSRGGGDWSPLAEGTIKARARRPISRLYQSLANGDINEEQFSKRIRGARKKAEKSLANYEANPTDIAILRDTNTLFNALDPGSLQEWVPYGIRVGYGGTESYPNGTSIADIAEFHQLGNSKLPKREILVEPPEDILQDMRDDVVFALHEIIKEYESL